MRDTDVTWHPHTVTREERQSRRGHHGCVIWFTGLSGCGKSTIANLVDHRLYELGASSFVLDGDNIRHGLNASPSMLAGEYGEDFARRFGLGFSAEDRQENIRRIGAVAELFAAAGVMALTAFVSPYRRDRDAVRRRLDSSGQTGSFIEVFVHAPLEVCESRDPKGLYRKARAGELRGFTGIDDPYEPPLAPELILQSGTHTPPVLAQQVIDFLVASGKLAGIAGRDKTESR
jgi:adenylylsulfate kinase